MEIAILASGSSGNCALVSAGRGDDAVTVCVDCGIAQRTGRTLAERAGRDLTRVDAVLLTHRHADHALNVVPVAARARAPLYAHPDGLGHSPRTAPAEIARRRVLVEPYASGRPFVIGPLRVTPVALPHDADPTHGFVFEADGRRAAYFTDLGGIEPLLGATLEGVETLVLESNHDPEMLRNGPYPPVLQRRVGGPLGHLANAQTAELLAAAAPTSLRTLVLAHLSRQNNRPELAAEAAGAALRARGRGGVDLRVAPPAGVVLAGGGAGLTRTD